MFKKSKDSIENNQDTIKKKEEATGVERRNLSGETGGEKRDLGGEIGGEKRDLGSDRDLIEREFRRDGSLMRRKLLEYIPIMMITNLSNLLLISVDGIVVGNMLGKHAFASVNIFGPVNSFIGAVTALAAMGISTSLSTAMGSNRQEEINRVRGASLRVMIFMAVFISLIQIPIVYLIISSYNLSPETEHLVWEYALGIMISSPLGMISTIGVYQMQIVGKMRILMWLAFMEGIANLIFNLVFIGVIHMGVAGAGFGTMCANILRASITVIYLAKFTDIYKQNGYKMKVKDLLEILRTGAPDCAYMLMLTFQNYFIMRILLSVFGSDGGVINGVAAFCYSLTNVLISGIQSSMRPLVGLLSGGDDRKGLSTLMKIGFRLNIASAGLCTLVTLVFPQIFYSMNGISDIPEGGIASLRFFSLYFIVKGINVLIRLYLVNRKDSKLATRLTIVGYALLPLIAFALSKIADAPWVWLTYLITEALMFAMLYKRYSWWKAKDKDEDYNSGKDLVLYMTITPDRAVEASQAVGSYGKGQGIDPRIANRVSMCIEEMVAYADKVKNKEEYLSNIEEIKAHIEEKRAQVRDHIGEHADKAFGMNPFRFSVQVMVRFRGTDAATVTVLDDGRHISLDIDEEKRKIATDNYEVMRKMAASLEYQYILDMNYTTLKFEV